MDVREVERSTGLSRANIRFYEKEGLIEPRRRENGYRDYSPEDVKTLLRVKLLRRLMISVEEIRSLQEAREDLGALLDRKMEELRRKQQEIMAAQRVCERMREDGMSYAGLEPARYLRMLEAEEQRGGQSLSIRKEEYILAVDQEHMEVHPCKRLMARIFDLAFYGLVIDIVWYGILRVHPVENLFLTLLSTYLSVLLVFLIEPVWLSLCATTPGKWLMGVRVYAVEGGRLSLSAALARTKEMLGRGMGWNLPGYNFYRLYKSYRQYGQDATPLDWDTDTEYTWKDQKAYRPWVSLGLWLAGGLLSALLMWNAQLPIHRGALNLDGFVENYNDYMRYLYPGSLSYMDESGQLQKREEPGAVVIEILEVKEAPAFTYRESEGILEEITYTVEYQNVFLVGRVTADMQICAFSFLGAQEGALWQGGLAEIQKLMGAGENFTFAGVEVTFDYEAENCLEIDGGYAVNREDEPSSLRIRMSMRKE